MIIAVKCSSQQIVNDAQKPSNRSYIDHFKAYYIVLRFVTK